MNLQQQFLASWSSGLFVVSNHNVCLYRRPLFRPVELENKSGFAAKSKCGRLISLQTNISRCCSRRAAQNRKSSRDSLDESADRSSREEDSGLGDGYNNAVEKKEVQDARNMEENVSQEEQSFNNGSDKRGLWQIFQSGLFGEKPSKDNSNDKINVKETGRPRQSIRFQDLLEPSPENLLVLLLTGLLLLAIGQTLLQLLLVSASILITAVKYSAIAAILLGILVALL